MIEIDRARRFLPWNQSFERCMIANQSMCESGKVCSEILLMFRSVIKGSLEGWKEGSKEIKVIDWNQ